MNRVKTHRIHYAEPIEMGQRHSYDAEVSLEEILDPLHFLPAAHRFRVGDIIEVFWFKDGWLRRVAYLRVLRIQPEAVFTALEGEREYEPFDDDEAEADDEGGEDESDLQFVEGEAKAVWNVGVQAFEVKQGETIVCAIKDKDLAHKIAAGEAPIPMAAEPEAA